jgi:glycerol-3-phosphate dehydrogenase
MAWTSGVDRPVLILGAGINGAALARELVLNAIPVCVVDTRDICSGASSASSHLIHGGLRYLEYGEFDLVRESLAERTRWLRLAPHLVKPLELFIPVAQRAGGLWEAARRFLCRAAPPRPAPRGLWLIRSGLWLYDQFARDPQLPRHRTLRVGHPEAVAVPRDRYRWLCGYYDALVPYPERFVLALLLDAAHIASQTGVPLEVFTYHQASLEGTRATVRRLGLPASGIAGPPCAADDPHCAAAPDTPPPARCFEPCAVVNATGAWVDHTLRALNVGCRRLIGPTQGSHFVTWHPALRDALGGRGLYAEAADGRPVFVLPLAGATLVGTTDIPFSGDPAEAVATEAELEYLLQAVRDVLDVRLTRDDIDWHYCGVRPLPALPAATPAAITRRHMIYRHAWTAVPMFSLVGGKLTTCRSLAEQTCRIVLHHLGRRVSAHSRDRPLPGAEGYPHDQPSRRGAPLRIAQQTGRRLDEAAALWELYGTAALAVPHATTDADRRMVPGTPFSRGTVRWIIQHEWVWTLEDLVCRRLMLLYRRGLSRQTLHVLGQLLAECGRLPAAGVAAAVDHTAALLQMRHGKSLPDCSPAAAVPRHAH